MYEWQKTIISQYYSSARLTTILDNLNDAVDPAVDLDAFYDLIWNVDTAEGYGLDVWGRIVAIGRVVPILRGLYFGFAEALPGVTTFGFGPFYSDQPLTEGYELADADYRRLIMAKAATNITNGSIPAINAILMGLFPDRGNAYVQDVAPQTIAYFGFAEAGGAHGFDGLGAFADYLPLRAERMRLRYVFEFDLEPWELAVVRYSGAVPRPAAVRIYSDVNLIRNGHFDADIVWTKGTGWTISGGKANKIPGSASDLEQPVEPADGRAYNVTFALSDYAAGSVTPGFAGGTPVSGTARSADGVYNEQIIAAAGNTTFVLSADAAFDGSVDDVRVSPILTSP